MKYFNKAHLFKSPFITNFFSKKFYILSTNYRAFSVSTLFNNLNSIEGKFPTLFYDKSWKLDSIIYKIYNNVYLNKQFPINIGGILEDLYDNNEFVIFKLYFIRIPLTGFEMDIPKLFKHFNQYPLEFILDNIVKFHKNSGVVGISYIFVWLSLNDINNLENIGKGLLDQITMNIKDINKNIHKDFGNTIINYKLPMDMDNELFLFISSFLGKKGKIDRSNPEMIKSKSEFYSKKS